MTPPVTARSVARAAPGTRRGPVRHPRRISGPARSSAVAAVAVPAPGIALPRQRPARPAQPRRRPARKAARRPVQGAPGIALRAIDALEGISSSAVLDRLIRGRVWIGLLAFALIGIVAMQLLVLELNTGIGHTLTRVAQLQRENAQLGIENSTYSAEGRIAPLAAATGMTLAPTGTIHFVAASPADVSRAAAALSTAVQAPSSSSSVQAPSSSSSVQVPSSSSSSSSNTSSSNTSGGGEAGGGSSEPSSSMSAGTPPSAPASTEATSTAASTPTSTTTGTPTGTAPQAGGASGAASSEGAAASTEASGSGGGTPAGPRE
jgi:hypothetical protein